MMTLPPAHTLGAALAQSVGGALLTILVICAPLLGLWALCRWLERTLPPADPPHPRDLSTGTGPATTPSGRIILQPVKAQAHVLSSRSSMMAPLALVDVDMAAVSTLPSLPIVPPALPPVSSSLGVLDGRPPSPDVPVARDTRTTRMRPQRPHGYILAPDGGLVRLTTLRLETVYPLEPWCWN